MSRYIFLFDLDSTVTKEEILPTIAESLGLFEQMRSLTESAMQGEVPFKKSFLQRVDILKKIPVSEVRQLVGSVKLNELLAEFIIRNRERCYIVTGNLDVWIEELIDRLDMGQNTFCSKALVKDDYILDVSSVLNKSAVVSQMVLPFVAVGDGNNDAQMIESAEIGIGYGGVREIAPAVLNCASHAIYEEGKLVEFLERLL